MSNYVVDASVIIEYLIEGSYTRHARSFFATITAVDRIAVPEFCLLECTNVIWKEVRFNRMPRIDAQKHLRLLRIMKLNRAPVKQLLGQALEIALDHNLAIYDSAYIALAMRSGYPLITLDQPQSRAASAEGVRVIPVTDFK